jgi:hypothetical protein
MHEEIMKDPLIVRCVGRWEEFTIYEVKSGFSLVDDNDVSRGFWIRILLDLSHWEKALKEMRAIEDASRNVFLHDYQIEALLKWVTVAPFDEKQSMTCKDCKSTGWYVGIVERYPCPTCKRGCNA